LAAWAARKISLSILAIPLQFTLTKVGNGLEN
jgi:hypothetical protein